MKSAASHASSFRKCANIKSKRHPDVPCTATAINGEFCARHYKRPHRYVSLAMSGNLITTRRYINAIEKIQKWWHFYQPFLAFRKRGPAANCRSLANNDSEVYSLEPISDIPYVFFFSYADLQKRIWAFDIRSLSALLGQGQQPTNPYTREAIPLASFQSLRDQIGFLRKQKYPLVYVHGDMTEEQEWNQRVLDVFMKLESVGYLSACSWFHEMTILDHKKFYRAIYQIWMWRLGLSAQEKEAIVPHHGRNTTRLFRGLPDNVCNEQHDTKWWDKQTLNIISNFITRSTDKTKQSLGALYVLMALVQVSEAAAEAYPWILDSVSS